jgi:hypothetical protein
MGPNASEMGRIKEDPGRVLSRHCSPIASQKSHCQGILPAPLIGLSWNRIPTFSKIWEAMPAAWLEFPEELAGLLSVTSRAPTQPSESSSWPRQDSRLPARTGSATVGSSTIDLVDGLPLPTELASLRPHRQAMPSPSGTDEPPLFRHRPNPYNDVPSLYDLYSQVSRRSPQLERFGMAIFRNGTGNLDDLPMDVPAGPEYVLGPGDGLNIELWGGVAQRLQRVVDREGRVALPEVGILQVSGRTLANVQQLVQSVMRTQFRDVEADISLARIRSVQIYVVGDVANPGAYDISSLLLDKGTVPIS